MIGKQKFVIYSTLKNSQYDAMRIQTLKCLFSAAMTSGVLPFVVLGSLSSTFFKMNSHISKQPFSAATWRGV